MSSNQPLCWMRHQENSRFQINGVPERHSTPAASTFSHFHGAALAVNASVTNKRVGRRRPWHDVLDARSTTTVRSGSSVQRSVAQCGVRVSCTRTTGSLLVTTVLSVSISHTCCPISRESLGAKLFSDYGHGVQGYREEHQQCGRFRS